LGLGLGLLLCVGIARYVPWRGRGGVLGCSVPPAAFASFLDALRPRCQRRGSKTGGAQALGAASVLSGCRSGALTLPLLLLCADVAWPLKR